MPADHPPRGPRRALRFARWLLSLGVLGLGLPAAGYAAAPEACPRPAAGGVLDEPADLRSRDGVLDVELSIRDQPLPGGSARFCYVLADGTQAPTLRLKPGDLLVLRLRNRLSGADLPAPAARHVHRHGAPAGTDPCSSGVMSLTSANLHFHGLSIPPVCHQDEVLRTSIQPGDPAFEYRVHIPADQPPGLYWYHPHIHGFSARQVTGGASGALIVEGIERANAELTGMPERVLVIRDQDLVHPDAPAGVGQAPVLVDRDGDALNTGSGTGRPARDLSVNYAPVPYPDYPPARIVMKPGERQLWRVLNASSVTYLNLSSVFQRGPRFQAQHIGLVSVDGVPLTVSGEVGHAIEWRTSIMISPGARAEFIVTAPPAGIAGMLVTRAVNTGPGGENDPTRPLATIESSPLAPATRSSLPALAEPLAAPARPWLGGVTPVRTRKLYFSEDAIDPNEPGAVQKFYLTVDGQTPVAFDPATTTPNIVVQQGDVEDWIIENRSLELHAFHIHQIHFAVMEWVGLAVDEPFLHDTINIPFWHAGMDHYPSVRLRMDFRDPSTVGTFLYHCHLLDHEDGGMMGLIRVEPAPAPGTLHERPAAP